MVNNIDTNMEMDMACVKEVTVFRDHRGIHREVHYVAPSWIQSYRETNEPGTANQDPAHVQIHSNAQHDLHHDNHHHQQQHHHGYQQQGHQQGYHHHQGQRTTFEITHNLLAQNIQF
ncbi:hypothetical protein CEXT_272371 [Caerostris extrusa]|uniref:Uncharacterized protein n=1 Tax=Caerostris extrusa TaxID=172846 RepID=A0AAV4SZD2_CAEEX|nr:hypothetical protein CEXT_272371 [Caerostris extrusa]